MKRNTKILLRVIVIVLALAVIIGMYLSNNIANGNITDDNATYNNCQYNVCFVNNSQWNVRCVNDAGKITSVGNTCSGSCVNSVCANIQIIQQGCSFGMCNSDVTSICQDKTIIVSYKCINNCAYPTNAVCKNADGSYPDNPLATSCKYYQNQNLDGSCSFSLNEAVTDLGANQLWNDNSLLITIIAAIIIIAVVFLITR